MKDIILHPTANRRGPSISWTGAALLVAIVALGMYLRLIPVLGNAGADLQWDASFGYRLSQEIVDQGRLPEVDYKTLHPVGRRTAEIFPVFTFYGAARYHAVSKLLLGIGDLKRNIFYYNSLCGALIAVPVFLCILAMTRRRGLALITALLATTLPIGIRRTFATYFRSEVLGVLMIMFCFAFVIRALHAKTQKDLWRESILAAVALFFALGSWRMSLVFLFMISIAVLLVLVFHKKTWNFSFVYGSLLIAFLAACLTLPYLSAHRYIFSVQSIFMFAVGGIAAVYQFLFRTKKIHLSRKTRLKLVGTGLVAVLVLISFSNRDTSESVESTFLSMARRSIASQFGRSDVIQPDDRLFGAARELQPVEYKRLPAGDVFSVAFGLLLLYFFMLYRNRCSQFREPSAFLVFVCLIGFMFQMLYVASRVMSIVAPFSVVAIGLGMNDLYVLLKDKFGSDIAGQNRNLWFFVSGGLAILLMIVTLDASYRMILIRGRAVQMKPQLRKLMLAFKQNTPKDAVVWANWQYGYPLQTYGERTTIMDGLFEMPEMRDRVRESAAALWSENEENIINYCRKYNAGYILIARTKLPASSMYLGLKFREYYTPKGPTEKGKKINLIRMFHEPGSMKDIKFLTKSKEYFVFYVPEILGGTNLAPPLSLEEDPS